MLDTSDIAAHKPNPQLREVGSTLFWKDGGQSQAALPVSIAGKPYLIFSQELGSGGGGASPAAPRPVRSNCRRSGFPKIIDISDDAQPARKWRS